MQEFQPIKFKYKKYHNFLIFRKLRKKEFRHFKLLRGDIGLKVLSGNVITSKQLSSFMKLIVRFCKKDYKIWLYCFPNISLTAKSISVRMGKGIGNLMEWIFVIKKNGVFLEIKGHLNNDLYSTLKKSKNKLPFLSTIMMTKQKKKWNRRWFL